MQRNASISDAIFTELTKFGRQQSQESGESKRAILGSLALIESTQRYLARCADANQPTLEDLRGKVIDLICLEKTSDISPPDQHSWKPKKATPSKSKKRTIYMSLWSWRLPIGYAELKRATKSTESFDGGTPRRGKHRGSCALLYDFVFIAPWWLSTSIVKISLQAQSQHGLTNWNRNLSYGMQNYNTDPNLGDCLLRGDIAGLQQMFDYGRARPTDYLPNGLPILMVSYRIICHIRY